MRRLLAVALPLIAWAQVPATDSRNTDIPDTNTHFKMPEYRTLAEWEARKKQLREQILVAAGLEPMPERTPLRAEVFGKITQKDYSIEKVLLETAPGYWLGGNLYRPVGKSGPFPGVASPHGHWNYGRLEHTPLGSIPARCISLARQGYVVLAYDMVGYNDTIQTPHVFGGAKNEQLWSFGPLGLQTWNSLRVVDFLSSLPDVDRNRIGATGASGGGTQTFLLQAIDDRVKFSSPVNMISAIMQGGSPCENAPGLRVGAFNVEIGAMMAPRPMLMVSATGDWTRNTLEEEYPAIKNIYALYDKASYVEAVRIQAEHNYNKDSREAVYRFFAKHALSDDNLPKYKEQGIRLEKLQDMLALHGRALPPGALTYDQLFAQWRKRSAKQVESISAITVRQRLLRLAVGAEWPSKVAESVTGEQVVLSRPAVGDRVPGIWISGAGKPVLVVHPDGAAAARQSDEVKKLLVARRPVLMIDAFQTGSAAAPRDRSKSHFLTFNRTEDALRVQDILTALRWLGTKGSDPELVGLAKASVWARVAASVAPAKVALRAETAWFGGSDQDFIDSMFVPGIQRAGGWKSVMLVSEAR